MKTRKIIGLLVACGGVVASFAAASALYKKGVADLHVGIGASYTAQTGSVTYNIDGKTSGTITPTYLTSDGTNDGHYFGEPHEDSSKGLYTQAHFVFPLSATYASNEQDYVLGNFSINITNLHENLRNHVHAYAEVSENGLKEIDGVNQYDSWADAADARRLTQSAPGTLLTESSFSVSKDITVKAAGGQVVDLYVKVDENVDAAWWQSNMLTFAEGKAFDVSVSWGEHSAGYQIACVTGAQIEWQHDEVYDMVPDLKHRSFQWTFKGLTGFSGGAKCKKPGLPENEAYSFGDNEELNSSTVYDVYWSGSNSDQAYFAARS